jgi:tight adherence protein B
MGDVFPLSVAAGLGGGTGLWLIFLAVAGRATSSRTDAPGRLGAALRRSRRPRSRRVVAVVVVAVVVAVLTRWPVAAALAGFAAYVLPNLIGPDREHQRALARVEAIAVWTESLRDTLSAAAGLEQAIHASADAAPDAIRAEVRMLAARIRRGQRLSEALRAFAADVDNAAADLVITALVMAADGNARNVSDLLTSLAAAARDQAAMRMRVAAGRAAVRTNTRVIVCVTLGLAVVLMVFNREYMAPYDSITGQLILLTVGAMFALGFWWLTIIGRIAEPARVLDAGGPL